jgi:DNA-binding PadR family transcriptional regulator
MRRNPNRMDKARRERISDQQAAWATINSLLSDGLLEISGRDENGEELYRLTEQGRAILAAPDEEEE